MKGGAKEHILDIIKKHAQPLNIYVGIILVLTITYIAHIPKSFAFRANSILGRLALFSITIAVAETYSWIYALLMALFTVLCIAVAPRTFREAFKDAPSDDIDVKMVTQSKKWWSETVLKEDPVGVEEDRVQTRAIQDNSNASNSNTSSR
jgi:c-di-AMP phosphodiesterase-like protein